MMEHSVLEEHYYFPRPCHSEICNGGDTHTQEHNVYFTFAGKKEKKRTRSGLSIRRHHLYPPDYNEYDPHQNEIHQEITAAHDGRVSSNCFTSVAMFERNQELGEYFLPVVG